LSTGGTKRVERKGGARSKPLSGGSQPLSQTRGADAPRSDFGITAPRKRHRTRPESNVRLAVYGGSLMSAPYLLAIDQGTTGTRAVVYDVAGRTCGSAGRELTQHYPQPGWVEHDAEEIWDSVTDVVPRALADAGIEARQLTALGLTNQRET